MKTPHVECLLVFSERGENRGIRFAPVNVTFTSVVQSERFMERMRSRRPMTVEDRHIKLARKEQTHG